MATEKGVGEPVVKLFGGLLMAVGALMVGLCGLCSAAFLVVTLGGSPGAIGGMVVLALVVGGVPIAAGVALLLFGRRLWRGSKSPRES